MSVFTPLDPSAINRIAAALGLSGIAACTPVPGGTGNTNYFVDLKDGRRFVLTVVERLQRHEMVELQRFLLALADAGLPVPLPVVASDGRWLLEEQGKPVLMVPRFSGGHAVEVNLAQATALGTLLATMHRVGATLSGSAARAHRNRWRAEHDTLFDALDAGERSLALDTMRRYEMALAVVDDALPAGMIHGDLFRDNVLFIDDAITGVIDFYDAHHDFLIYDLAIVFNDWFHLPRNENATHHGDDDVVVSWPLARACFAAYQRTRRLSDAERHVFPCAVQAAAMSFWLFRRRHARDPLRGDTVILQKNPNAYLQRLLSARALGDVLREAVALPD